jgi:hypothetical protein
MKKLKMAMFSALALGLAFTSCGDDDSSSNTSGKLEGKWIYSQEKEGDGALTDYEHTVGCDKDYILISAEAIKDVWFDKEGTECVENSDSVTYTREGNVITTQDGVGTIDKLTATELVVSSIEIGEGGTTVKYVSTYKRG